MEFRILGPLELVSDGTTVRPRGVEARLLAVLLLDAGRAVSLTRLVEGVWDGDAPATATRQVSNTVSMLRRKLGDQRIKRIADGYTLDPSGCTVDALRFGDLVKQARTTRDTEPRAALALLRESLSLWRGAALADLPGRVIGAGARSFEESRLATLEDRIDLELELGESADVANEARRILAENPYRQKVAGQLMLALHRQQRTPEALEVFEQLRIRLADDVGLDPGEPLRDLHTAILRADPALDLPTAQPAPTATTTTHFPAQLPVKPAGFTGRVRHLAALDDALTDPTASCALTGAAGTGKTALAVHWAHRVRDKFGDGQLFLNLRGFDHGEPVSPTEALGRFIRALHGPDTPIPSDMDEAVMLFRSILDGKRVLIVLDNARDAAQVRPLLPPGPGSFAVITSRHRLRGLTAVDATVPIELSPMADDESADLLTSMIDLGRLGHDPGAVARLAELCGHLPLALRIAAAQLATRPGASVADLAEELDGPRRLDTLSLDGDPEATVAATLDLSFQALNTDARQLFLRLGLIPGEDYSRELITVVSDHTENQARKILGHLESVHLIEQYRPGRYRFHDLTRLYAAAQAGQHIPAEDRRAVLAGFIDWHYGRRQDTSSDEDTNVYVACHALRDQPNLWKLVASQIGVINSGRRLERVRILIDLGLAATEAETDREGRFWITRLLASYHWATGELPEALAVGYRAAELAEDLDAHAKWIIKATLCSILESIGNIAEAANQMRSALHEIPEDMEWGRLFTWRMNLSGMCVALGEYKEAHELLSLAELQLTDRDSRQGGLKLIANRAYLQLESGAYDQAAATADTAIDEARALNHVRYECLLLVLRAEARRRLHDTDRADHDLSRALKLADELQQPSTKVEVLRELTMLYHSLGKHDRAYDCVQQLTGPELSGSSEAIAQADIALVRSLTYTGIGELGRAVETGTEAVELNAAMPRPLHHGRSLVALAEAHAGLGEPETARDLRKQALQIFTTLGVPEAETLRGIKG